MVLLLLLEIKAKNIIFFICVSRFPNLNFDYRDPEPNFDRSRVKGLVSSLFKINDPKFCTALEVAAGAKVNIKK